LFFVSILHLKAVATGPPTELHIWSYWSATCNVTVTHDECAVNCTRLGRRNIPNLTLKIP